MRNRALIALLIILLGGVALALLAFGDGLYLSTTTLQNRQVVEDGDGGFQEHFVELVGEDGEVVAVAGAEVEARAEDLYWLRVSVWHEEGTVLDALTVRLNLDQIAPEVALMTPGATWPLLHYGQTPDGRGVLVEIPDLGTQGRGTVTLEFFLGSPLTASPPEQLDLDLELALHEESRLRIGRSVGEVSIAVPLR